MFLLGLDEELSLEAGVVHARLQLVEQRDHVLLGQVERDTLGLGHLLELDHGELVEPTWRRDLLQLLRQLLGVFECRLLLGQQSDQLLLAA